jgi:hypothetical protein
MTNPLGQPAGLPGQNDPVYQTWVMLLNGYGYNWYRIDNQLRADDLLVRSRASEHLAAAAGRLREIELHYRRKYLPPPSREQPFADPDRLADARRIRDIGDRVAAIDTRIRGAAVPPNDKIWARHRNEVDTLMRLGQCDVVLVGVANDLLGLVSGLTPDNGIDAAAEARIDQQLEHIRTALTQRGELLA